MRKEFFLLRYHINVIERKYLHQKFNRATWGKVLTLDQIQRRGFYLTNRCFLCLSEVETVDRILLHCAMLWVLWDLLFSLIGVSWVPSCLVKKSLLGWHGSFTGKACKKAWQVVPLCLFWTMWKE